MIKATLLISAFLMAFNFCANAWDAVGHMLVDQIAWQSLRPEVRFRATKLAEALDAKYNANERYHFATVGCWMDDMRAMPGYPWSTLHYVNIAYTPSGLPCEFGTEPNILSGIEDAKKTLQNKAASPLEKAVALAMVTHFVGDIHQPLHCTDWNDQGGNGYLIYGVPITDAFSKRKAANLHMFWDAAYRFDDADGKIVDVYASLTPKERPKDTQGGFIHDEAAKIIAAFPEATLGGAPGVSDPRDWARESHSIGCLFAYPARSHPDNTEAVTLLPDYAHKARDVARQRIALAGYRLAFLLNEILGDPLTEKEKSVVKASPTATPIPAAAKPLLDGIFAPNDLVKLKSELGKTVKVEGRIESLSANKSGSIRYLNFDKQFQSSVSLVFFLTGAKAERFTAEKLQSFVKKRVRVTGKLEKYREALQISIEDLKQIEILAD